VNYVDQPGYSSTGTCAQRLKEYQVIPPIPNSLGMMFSAKMGILRKYCLTPRFLADIQGLHILSLFGMCCISYHVSSNDIYCKIAILNMCSETCLKLNLGKEETCF
jgi:hypothetical protein